MNGFAVNAEPPGTHLTQYKTIDYAWIYTFDREGDIVSTKCYDQDDDLLYVKKAIEPNVYEIRNTNEKLIWKQIKMLGNPVIEESIYCVDTFLVVSKSEGSLDKEGRCEKFMQYNSQGLLYSTIVECANVC
ncbi:hypothetical protein [Bacteroides sp. 519]|uniref:hypothetical protein n=1 Tax=Bacteroides sp. 519 TaxID=2302937 RepID=UPI00194024DF|nr:hypothetical protein [Bacteroides sp. 519]NDV58743.1 hypothetical protein [Bacteroides sp. 519]